MESEPTSEVDVGDLDLIDEALALTPEERLHALEVTLKSLEALRVATDAPLPAE